MGHYVKIEDNIVIKVLIAEQSYIDSGAAGDPSLWMLANENDFPDYRREGNQGVGFTYDSVNNKFIAPQPYSSWTYDAVLNQWNAPIPYPTDGQWYQWNEELGNWTIFV